MAEELGNQMQGDPTIAELNPDDIISVDSVDIPQTNQENSQEPTENPPSDPPDSTTAEPQTSGTEEQVPDTPSTQQPEGTEQTTTTVPPVEPVAPPVVDPWDNVLNTVKERTGVQYSNADQMVEEISAYKQFKQDPYANLPVEVKTHIEFLESGGNTNEFYRLKSLDFNTMTDKEVLFQSYLRDKPEHAANMDFARMDFERSYNADYGILQQPKKTLNDFMNEDDEIDREAYNRYEQDYNYWEQKAKIESGISRAKLIDWQQKATTPQVNEKTGLNDEQARDFMAEHKRQVDQVKTSYKGEVFPLSDKPEENLNLGLSDAIRQKWETDLENPMTLFNELGLMSDGKLDMEKFKSTAFIFRIWPQLGPIVSKYVLEQQNRQTVVGQQVNPPSTTSATPTHPPGEAHGDDEELEAAELFFQQEQERRRSRY